MRWMLFVPLLVVLALLAHSNPQDVELRLWPFDVTWQVEAGIAMLTLAAFGFMLGALLVWVTTLPVRRRAARLQRAARLLEGELATYKARGEKARRDADLGRVPESELVPSLPGRR